MLSIVIPSRQEKFLNKTILDILEKATGEIEIFPVLDGYTLPKEEIIRDQRVKYIHLPSNGSKMQKRQGVNLAISLAKGEYVASSDAHCMFDRGFDEKLAKAHQPNWVQVPRRKRLDADLWTISDGPGQPPIDYEYWMWNTFCGKTFPHGLHGYKWNERTIAREKYEIDEALTIQASFWFMTKEWFKKMGLMQVKGYTGWGQEAEEICLKTWTSGGKVMTNKTTWYAHLHKGRKHGRMYFMSKNQVEESYMYAYDYWVRDHFEEFAKIIDHFMPLPGWPPNWREGIIPKDRFGGRK